MDNQIHKILSSDLSDAEKAREINFLLRKAHIYIKKEHLKSIKSSAKVTIDFTNTTEVLPTTEKETDYIKIYGYSFGPFKPEYYFNPNTLRILWILKEPILTDMRQIEGRVEGIAQDQFYSTWEQIENDEWKDSQNKSVGTKTEIIRISQQILSILGQTCSVVSKFPHIKDAATDKNALLQHLCIIELNHFPGISYNDNWKSDDSKVGVWANRNRFLLNELLGLYNPHVVFLMRDYGAFVATYHDEKNNCQTDYQTSIFNVAHVTNITGLSPLDHLQKSYPNSKLVGKSITACGPMDTKKADGTTIKSSYIVDANTCIWIGFHHPTSTFWSDYNISVIAQLIATYL